MITPAMVARLAAKPIDAMTADAGSMVMKNED